MRKAQNGEPVANRPQTHPNPPQPGRDEDRVDFHNLVWPFDEPR